MNRIRILFFVLCPLVVFSTLTSVTWLSDKTLWYFRGYEYYSEWVYPGLAEPDVVMRESGDSAREFIFDHSSSVNSISLNESRSIPTHPAKSKFIWIDPTQPYQVKGNFTGFGLCRLSS